VTPHDADLHPPGFTPIASVNGGTVAVHNGTGYWLDDAQGTQTALSRLPKAKLAELVLEQAELVSQLRDGLAEVFKQTAALEGRARGLEGEGDASQ
jgi:hypothetical protein